MLLFTQHFQRFMFKGFFCVVFFPQQGRTAHKSDDCAAPSLATVFRDLSLNPGQPLFQHGKICSEHVGEKAFRSTWKSPHRRAFSFAALLLLSYPVIQSILQYGIYTRGLPRIFLKCEENFFSTIIVKCHSHAERNSGIGELLTMQIESYQSAQSTKPPHTEDRSTGPAWGAQVNQPAPCRETSRARPLSGQVVGKPLA